MKNTEKLTIGTVVKAIIALPFIDLGMTAFMVVLPRTVKVLEECDCDISLKTENEETVFTMTFPDGRKESMSWDEAHRDEWIKNCIDASKRVHGKKSLIKVFKDADAIMSHNIYDMYIKYV